MCVVPRCIFLSSRYRTVGGEGQRRNHIIRGQSPTTLAVSLFYFDLVVRITRKSRPRLFAHHGRPNYDQAYQSLYVFYPLLVLPDLDVFLMRSC